MTLHIIILIGTQGDGIHAARLDERTGQITPLGLMAAAERPTCVLADPDRALLYAVSEVGNAGDRIGEVLGFRVAPETGTLTPLNRMPSGGGGPTHLALDPARRALFVANFGGGQVAVIPIAEDGTLRPIRALRTGTGSGPHRRQKGPHAHGVTLDPSGRFLLAPDMGTDRIYVYPYDRETARLDDRPELHVALPAGAGPRLVLFGKDGRFAYLLTELSAHIHTFAWSPREGRLTPTGALALDAPDAEGAPSAAGFFLSADGRFLYATNRRSHAIHAFAIAPEGGHLTPAQTLPAGGDKPWAIGITPSGRWLLAAHQGSETITLFAVDPASGRLTAMPGALPIPSPTGLAFMPASLAPSMIGEPRDQ